MMSLSRSFIWIAAVVLASSVVPAQAQSGSTEVTDKNIKRILGTWKIQKIMSGNTEVAKNPTSGQWIEFRTDGKYVFKVASPDSGSYRLNENESTLYLESMVHADPAKHEDKKIVEWAIAFENEGMTLQQKSKGKKAHVDIMKYVYTRID